MSPRRFFGTDAGVGLLQTRHGQVKRGCVQGCTAHDGKASGSDPCEAGKSESSLRTLAGVLFLLGEELGNGKGDEVPAAMTHVRVVLQTQWKNSRANKGVCCLRGVLIPNARLATVLCRGVPDTEGAPSRKSGGAFGIVGLTRVDSSVSRRRGRRWVCLSVVKTSRRVEWGVCGGRGGR